jgi:hypothetical protein
MKILKAGTVANGILPIKRKNIICSATSVHEQSGINGHTEPYRTSPNAQTSVALLCIPELPSKGLISGAIQAREPLSPRKLPLPEIPVS